MLLQERMKEYPFSNSEKIVINYILDKQEEIIHYSAKMIADDTFTSPSILIRIAKKLDYNGWTELKKAYLDEINYLNKHFQTIDANFPFNSDDTITAIANKITLLNIETSKDTLSLIDYSSLKKAVQIMNRSDEIRLFAVDNLNYIGEEFVFKLNRINKKAAIFPVSDNMYHDAAMSTSKQCAICISYSGETPTLLKTVELLKSNNVPIIAITSIGFNSLSELADTILRITTREKSYSKIAGFSSLQSISLILDILFSCLFSLNHDANIEYKLRIAEIVENNREITNPIIEEKSEN